MHSILKTNKLVGVKTKHVVKSTRCQCHSWNPLCTPTYEHSKSWRELSLMAPCPLMSTRLFSNSVRSASLRRNLSLDSHYVICLKLPQATAFPPVLGSSSHESCRNQFLQYNASQIVIRQLHIGSIHYDKEPLKPSSKVEETVEALKQEKKESAKPVTSSTTVEKATPPKKSLGQKIVAEFLHYYHGFRLLFIDINVSRKLVWKILNGKSLTRREHKLLVRTVSDMFRLVPFSVFVIVPFMELLLPLAIKMFPGMLPSTFQTATEKDDKMKQSLKVKLEMAKFLQKTLDDMAVVGKGHRSEAAKEFADFFVKVRTSGEQATNEEIMKFSKLFEDEITLDSLSRQQLAALCRVLEIAPLGTNNFLRFQLRMKLRSLAADDKVIQKEGIDQLTPVELQQACRARGMRAYGLPTERLRSQLKQWLDLSLNEKVPPSLLLLSRALLLPDTIPTSDQLKATISVLPDTVATQTKAAIGEREGKVDNKTKIEVIKEEERKIREERAEQKEEEKKEIAREEVLVDKAPIIRTEREMSEPRILLSKPIDALPAQDKKQELTSTDLETLEDALEILSKDKKLLVEKEELDDLKEELAEYKEDVDDLHQVLKTVDKSKAVAVRETKAAKRLYKKVNSMIGKMDAVLNELDKEGKTLKEDLKVSTALEEKEVKKKSQALVSIEELMDSIKQIQKVPDNSLVERISEVLEKIDIDHDGAIAVDDVLKVIELVGKENVKLDQKQLDEILELIQKEEIIELEDQIERALAKGALIAEAEEEEKQKKAEEIKDMEKELAAAKPITPIQEEEKRKQGSVSTVPPIPASQSAKAMAAAAPVKPADVNEPKDPKDNSKTL